MKLLFLDVDGVLNYDMCGVKIGSYYGVVPEKVKLLKQIIDATGAKIVLSSSWRRDINIGAPLENQTSPFAVELIAKLEAEGLHIYDMTSVEGKEHLRKTQIEELIHEYRRCGQPVSHWAVLDDYMFDGYDDPDFEPHVVYTNFYGSGLTEKEAAEAIAILNAEVGESG